MMAALLELAASWQSLVTLAVAVGVFGFLPGFLLRLLVKIYPPGDPRRLELPAELYAVKLPMRPFWVAQQFETVLHEGTELRFRNWKFKRHGRQLARDSVTAMDQLGMEAIADMDVSENDMVFFDFGGSEEVLAISVHALRRRQTRARYRPIWRSRKRRAFMRRFRTIFTVRVGPPPASVVAAGASPERTRTQRQIASAVKALLSG